MKADLKTFDGKDNRKEIMILLQRLGSARRRALFLRKLLPDSELAFAHLPVAVTGPCDAVAAYFCMVGICNELGVPIDVAARRLEEAVRGVGG